MPTSEGWPITWASRWGPTSSSRNCREPTAATRPWPKRWVNPFGMTDERIDNELCSDNPVDLCRDQVLNCSVGRIGLINSRGASGSDDMHQAIRIAVINKRAGGSGLIMGRKAFQKPRHEGIALIQAVQHVYLSPEVTID